MGVVACATRTEHVGARERDRSGRMVDIAMTTGVA